MIDALKYAEQIAYSSKEVLHFTHEKAKEQSKYIGTCFVECGCAAGAQIIAMLAANVGNKIYAFDSFKGIPLPSNKDNQMPGIRFLSKEEQKALPDPGKQVLESSGATSVSMKDFANHLATAFYPTGMVSAVNILSRVLPIEGWFEETLPEMAPHIEPISLLRLDADLYHSTYVCLKYLYPKVIKGGLVIVDDIQLPGCEAAVHDYFRDTNQIMPGRSWKDGIIYFYKP
jgi:O-methyltransferase